MKNSEEEIAKSCKLIINNCESLEDSVSKLLYVAEAVEANFKSGFGESDEAMADRVKKNQRILRTKLECVKSAIPRIEQLISKMA